MGKGVLPDSHPQNTASARSTALKLADVVLVLGARLNWILHFGDAPKWNPKAQIIQVDISSEEVGRNQGDASLGLVGDVAVVVEQLLVALDGWRWDSCVSDYTQQLLDSKRKNETAAAAKAKVDKSPMTYERAFSTIKAALDRLSPSQEGNIVYVSEGANTMDISRSIFSVEHPRLRLDAGTYATMGVGMGYAIAAHIAYNNRTPHAAKKKVVAIEGDSAFGFSAMEVETMARYQMDILIFVINNGGVYHGDSRDADEWLKLQEATAKRTATKGEGLRSWSLGWEVGYEKIAEACGGIGFLVRTPEELARATEEGFKAKVPVVVNVIIEAGKAGKLVRPQTNNNSPG
jgi:2-hydroxyacyl-CoA lyase 1